MCEKKKKYRKRIRERNSEYIYKYLEGKVCAFCGEDDIVCLEFDHYIGEKSFEINNAVRNRLSLKKIQEEISKCRILCANCHRKHTAEVFNYYRHKRKESI